MTSFFRTFLLCVACLLLSQRQVRARAIETGAPDAVLVAAISASDSSGQEFQMGVELAAGNQSSLGGEKILVVAQTYAATTGDMIRAVANAVEAGAVAVISHVDAPASVQLSRYLTQMAVVHINAKDSIDAARRSLCARFTFHVAPSAKMLADARRLAGVAPGKAAAVLPWHGSGIGSRGRELNAAFRSRYSRDVTPDAWLGWASMTIVRSGLSASTGRAVDLRDYLERSQARFDLGKGTPLSFRAWDHQLRQPVYVVKDSAGLAAEIPGDSLLDTIGDGPGRSECGWGS